MQRIPSTVLCLHRQLALRPARTFATASVLASKASKNRSHKVKWSAPPPAQLYGGNEVPGQAGTDVGQGGAGAGGRGLFEADSAAGEAKVEEVVGPEQVEREMLASQGPLQKAEEQRGRENFAGTDVGRSGQPASSRGQGEFGPEEIVYTANPAFNVPLMLSVSFVMAVFCYACADMARTGVEVYNEEKGEYENVPKWKRYTLAGSAAAVGTGIVVLGTLSPTRVITKLTIRRSPASLTSPYPFPRDSLVTIENALSPITSKFGQKPRTVPLARIHLLGPLSDSPKPYHPLLQAQQQPKKKDGFLSSFFGNLRTNYLAPSRSKQHPTPWNKSGKRLSHSPIVVEGDRASYSLALKRAQQPHSADGAWCKDWDALERALLDVPESKWTTKR